MATTTQTSNIKQQRGKSQKGGSARAEAHEDGQPTSDATYGVVSVLYHALQAADTLQEYIEDATESDDESLVAFFQETRQQQNQIAQRARTLLADRLSNDDGEDEDEDD